MKHSKQARALLANRQHKQGRLYGTSLFMITLYTSSLPSSQRFTILSFPPLQTLPHKLPLRKAQPPLTRHIRTTLINPRQQSLRQLLSNLHQVLLQDLCVLAVLWRLEHLVEWETWVAWDGEVGVEGDVLHFFLCLSANNVLAMLFS